MTTSRPIVVDGRLYHASRLPDPGPASRADGVLGYYELRGPGGTRYLAVDYGPSHRVTTVSVTGRGRIRGLTRAHLANLA